MKAIEKGDAVKMLDSRGVWRNGVFDGWAAGDASEEFKRVCVLVDGNRYDKVHPELVRMPELVDVVEEYAFDKPEHVLEAVQSAANGGNSRWVFELWTNEWGVLVGEATEVWMEPITLMDLQT